jgi:hypothetical protein
MTGYDRHDVRCKEKYGVESHNRPAPVDTQDKAKSRPDRVGGVCMSDSSKVDRSYAQLVFVNLDPRPQQMNARFTGADRRQGKGFAAVENKWFGELRCVLILQWGVPNPARCSQAGESKDG